MMAGRCCITLCMLAVLANTGQSLFCYYNDPGKSCAGPSFIASSAEECCSFEGGGDTFLDGGTCTQCAGIGFERDSYIVHEGANVLTVHIVKFPAGRPSEQDFELLLETTALSPFFIQSLDLKNPVPEMIPFPADLQRIPIQLRIVDDSIPENRETFELAISDGVGCRLAPGCFQTTTVTIVDNDGWTVGFDRDSVLAVESDGNLELCANITSPEVPLEFDFSLEAQYLPGSAELSTDYIPVSTSLYFTSGRRRACSVVTIVDSSAAELQESFTVRVSTAPNPLLTISPDEITVTIVDDDALTIFQFDQDTYTTKEGSDLEVCVAMRGTPRDVTLSLCTINGNAIDGNDYISLRQDLTFSPHSAVQCVTIEILDDYVIEDLQTFTISIELSLAVSDVEVLTPTATVVIYDENELPEVTTTCDAEDYHISAVQEESQKEVIKAIQNVLPIIPVDDDMGSRAGDKSLEELHEEFAEAFNTTTTETNYNNFVEAVTEIANAQRDACSGPDDTKPTTTDIPRLISDFKLAFFGGDQNLQDARSVVGKMLCVQEQLSASKRKKRQLPVDLCDPCECPVGGLETGTFTCPCEFFKCLDEENLLEPIVGFSNPEKEPCVAFLIDVTGSMGDEIEHAQQIITDFLSHQEDEDFHVCYILVPFTDNGSPDNSVFPIVYADTLLVGDLTDFYEYLQSLRAVGGGDTPEYAFDAIVKALMYTREGFTPLQDGAHIVVLTDAPSKRVELADDIISIANANRVCIHFFLDADSYDYFTAARYSDPVYNFAAFDRINENTAGTLVPNINPSSLSQFIETYETEPCEHVMAKKRSAPIISECSVFLVSQLATSVRISVSTSDSTLPPFTVRRPDGSTSSPETITQDLAKVSEANPQSGEWTACSEGGAIEVSVYPRLSLNTVVVYTIGDYVTTTPYTCATKIAILTSQAPLMHSVNLNLVTAGGAVVHHTPMRICGESLIANVESTLPLGEFTYHIDGIDTLGAPFEYDTKKMVKFIAGEYALSTLDGPSIEVQMGSAFMVSFELNNLNSVCNATFTFSIAAAGFHVVLTPEQFTVAPGDTIRIEAQPFVTSSSVQPGTSHIFTLTAASADRTLTAAKTVIITAPPPPPTLPPDACGCQNGGTCVITVRRGRERRRCLCPSNYIGLQCEVEF